MLMAELDAAFPWGLLLITDAASKEPIPAWAAPEEQVAAAESALVVRVLHADEGEVAVRVWSTPEDASGVLIFTGDIQLSSGILKASDALGTMVTEWSVEAGRHPIQIFVDSNVEASAVHVVLS
jgi:hypothetical protein